jgi:hypothetical protein
MTLEYSPAPSAGIGSTLTGTADSIDKENAPVVPASKAETTMVYVPARRLATAIYTGIDALAHLGH